jgi:nucleoside-diphosphate-sugar epimerase
MIGAFFSSRKTLVTGGRGFIGGRLCKRLVEAGAEVHAISRGDQPPGDDLIEWHRADLADADAVEGVVLSVRPDTVFHLGGQVYGDPGQQFVRPMLESNLLGTVNVLTAVEGAGSRRMVMTGTVVEPCDEAPATSPYAAAKGAATEYARMFHALYGTPVVCLRVAMVYGPGHQHPDKLIPHVVTSLLQGEAPRISSGRWEVDWIYVDDVVRALLRAAVAEEVEGHVLDVGSGDVASVRDVVERLADIAGGRQLVPRLGVVEDRPLERSVSSNLAQTRDLLGWAAATPLSDGLRKTVQWYRERLPVLLFALDAAVGAL